MANYSLQISFQMLSIKLEPFFYVSKRKVSFIDIMIDLRKFSQLCTFGQFLGELSINVDAFENTLTNDLSRSAQGEDIFIPCHEGFLKLQTVTLLTSPQSDKTHNLRQSLYS